jgi:HEAT repeat protein
VSLEAGLDSTDAGLRVAAASALGALARPESRIPLERTLEDPDWRVRAQAAYGLSRLHDPKSTTALVELLTRDASALCRNASALALGRIGDPRSIPALERALDDVSDRVRREAVLALERCGDPRAAEKVRRLIHDPARSVRIATAVVLGLRRDRGSAELLLGHLPLASSWEKPALLVALGRIGTEECGAALARCADDPVRWVRVCALHGLAEMRSPLARDVARAKLRDPAWAVRGAAALALGKVGEPADVDRLVPVVRDPNPWVRRGAVYALGQLEATGSLDALRPTLDDPDPEVRLAGIWVLGRLRDSASADRLIGLLAGSRPRDVAPRTIAAEGDGAVRLVSDAESRVFDALVEAVGSLAFGPTESASRRALAAARRDLSDPELDRPARLPSPLGPGESRRTLRSLFDAPGSRD